MDQNGTYDFLYDGGIAGTATVTLSGLGPAEIQTAAEALIPAINAQFSGEFTLTSIRAYGSELLDLDE